MHTTETPAYAGPQGTVYGVLLNFTRERQAWAERAQAKPYQGEPQAPVLYIKTANTFNASGGAVRVPPGEAGLEVGATWGLLMGEGAQVRGMALFIDWSVPHDSFYRPPVRFKNRDGFLGHSHHQIKLHDWAQLAALPLRVLINGECVQTVEFSGLHRDAARLLSDVQAFTDLQAGDVLMLGLDVLATGQRPVAQAGDVVRIEAPHGLFVEQHVLGVVA
jgi:5-oxopent-3-ene-1,2,5-tricarboxylate decarboxylase/2-hydroxyhepta-2,4-diene-1,7-dioate isomerase